MARHIPHSTPSMPVSAGKASTLVARYRGDDGAAVRVWRPSTILICLQIAAFVLLPASLIALILAVHWMGHLPGNVAGAIIHGAVPGIYGGIVGILVLGLDLPLRPGARHVIEAEEGISLVTRGKAPGMRWSEIVAMMWAPFPNYLYLNRCVRVQVGN